MAIDKKKIIIGTITVIAAYYLLDVSHGLKYMEDKFNLLKKKLQKKKSVEENTTDSEKNEIVLDEHEPIKDN